MWIDENKCKLCLVTSRSSDLIKLGKNEFLPQMLKIIASRLENDRYTSRDEIFTQTFNDLKELINDTDPYRSLKNSLNKLGKELAEVLRRELQEKDWDIDLALKFSVNANIIDTSVLGYEPKDLKEAIWDDPIKLGDVKIPKQDRIYLVLDNSGEAYIDLLLAESLKRHGYDVKTVARSESYEIDVTRDDMKVDITTPSNIPSVKFLNDGFIIAKGIANLEAYISINNPPPALLLFRTKCDVLSFKFRVKKNTPIIATGEYARKILLSQSS